MAELIILGTAASVPDAGHDTVALALRGPDWAVPIDCGGSPLHKLARHGVSLPDIRAVILTHRHTDHIYGLPMLVQGLWLGGREEGLPLYGPAEALEAAGKLLEILQLADREEIFPIEWHSVPLREGRRVMEIGDVRITSAPGVHAGVQTLALRFDNPVSGRSIVYSSDTEPCPAVRRLAAGANLLIHEATGTHAGHSSPAQAAGVARQAGVEQLALIHYPVQGVNLEAWRRAAGEFSGPVTLAQDGDIYPL
jgi:ribonuclease Z